jgi:hypothetical protein
MRNTLDSHQTSSMPSTFLYRPRSPRFLARPRLLTRL